MNDNKIRCQWCLGFDDYIKYHDQEWGVPVHDDRVHFEFIILEGAQAGLSWSTILKKREGYRQAFVGFRAEEVAQYSPGKVEELILFPGIVRNRLKVQGAVINAQKFLEVQEVFGSFDSYIWQFVDNKSIVNEWKDHRQAPATTKESDALSRDMKKRGFKFAGSTVMYAHMQATGLVNDHIVDCFRHGELSRA